MDETLNSDLMIPVRRLLKQPPLFVDPNATAQQAAQTMQKAQVGSVLVAADPPGIVSDRDLRGRLLAAGLGPETNVKQIMSQPLRTIDADAPAFAALSVMIEANIHHLPLVEEGKIIGVISSSDLLARQAKNAVHLRAAIGMISRPQELAHYAAEIAAVADALFDGGLGAMQISQVVSSLNDALVRRMIELAQVELGAPPAPFAWIVFGSEGRLEQTLLTDQDNALVYGAGTEETRHYFAELSGYVVDGLIQAGFPPCPGGFMATHWCKPLADWQQLFGSWLQVPKPDALLDAAIFFDFRIVAGTLSLEPLEEVMASARSRKLFLAHLLNNAVKFRPPLGIFNRIRTEDGAVDLKMAGIGPIVALARCGALAAGSRARSTIERLRIAGGSAAVLAPSDAGELGEIFLLLFRLRLHRQLAAVRGRHQPNHRVALSDLSRLERRHLKEAFIVIKNIQRQIEIDWQLARLG